MNEWTTKVPKYSARYSYLFESLSQKYGAEGEKKINLGKHFATNYELYMYAFFLGLYENERVPIAADEKRIDFSHAIQNWGSKGNNVGRRDFSELQDYMFMAVFANTEVDFLILEKDLLSSKKVVSALVETMESYTNGGLQLIKEKLEDNPNFFLQPTSFLHLISATSKEGSLQ